MAKAAQNYPHWAMVLLRHAPEFKEQLASISMPIRRFVDVKVARKFHLGEKKEDNCVKQIDHLFMPSYRFEDLITYFGTTYRSPVDQSGL